MGWTKRQFIETALEEIGFASYVYDIQPEQLNSALRKMDAMLSTWYGQEIRIGYPVPTSPENSDLDEETNVPDAANEAILLNLAVRLGPSFGKTVSIDTKVSAKKAYDQLLGRAMMPAEMSLPSTMPSGAGNRWTQIDDPFLPGPNGDPIQYDSGNGQLIFGD
jgi:hypothetical protein